MIARGPGAPGAAELSNSTEPTCLACGRDPREVEIRRRGTVNRATCQSSELTADVRRMTMPNTNSRTAMTNKLL